MIERNLQAKNITLYDNLVIEIDPFVVRIEDHFINTFFDFLKGVDEATFDPEKFSLNSLQEYLDEHSQIQKDIVRVRLHEFVSSHQAPPPPLEVQVAGV